jgi:hypothetical protein
MEFAPLDPSNAFMRDKPQRIFLTIVSGLIPLQSKVCDIDGADRSMESLSPWDVLETARRAVPAIDFALAAAAVAAAGAIIVGFLGRRRATVIIVGGVFVAMILLFVFSKLVAAENLSVVNAGVALLWAVVAFFIAFLVFTATAVALGWPRPWADVLGLESSDKAPADFEKLEAQINLSNSHSSENAIAAMLGIALVSEDTSEREAIAAIFKEKLKHQPTRNFDSTARGIRRSLMQALIKIRKFNVRDDFLGGELSNSDLVAMDFKNVDARGVDFSRSILLASDFRGADLRGANFSSAGLRSVQFRNADLRGAVFAGADWFNAIGLSKEQMQTIEITGMKACPTGSDGEYSKDSFIEAADSTYAVSFRQWSESEQAETSKSWAEYSRAGGLCDFVKGAK